MSTNDSSGAATTREGYQDRLAVAREDLAVALAHAIHTGDGWDLAGNILASWINVQAEESLRQHWSVNETRHRSRVEATLLIDEMRVRRHGLSVPPD